MVYWEFFSKMSRWGDAAASHDGRMGSQLVTRESRGIQFHRLAASAFWISRGTNVRMIKEVQHHFFNCAFYIGSCKVGLQARQMLSAAMAA